MTEQGTLRCPIEAGIAAYPAIRDVANYGRAHGATVDLHVQGWLVKRGWFVARGDLVVVRKLREMLTELERQSG